MRIVEISRADWGASTATEAFIAQRMSDPAAGKDSVIVHHTGAIDVNDDTPNRWDYSEALAYVKRLQTVRPDLGPLPYSYNPFISEDLETVWMFQGRGPLKRGAHTAGGNVRGIGYGIGGNFDRRDDPAAVLLLAAISDHAYQLKTTLLPNLGKHKGPSGGEASGHRDWPGVTKTCPGNTLYPYLASFTIQPLPEPEPEPPMSTEQFVRRLTPARVEELVHNGVILPNAQWVIDHWTAMLETPDHPDWSNVIEEIEVMGKIRQATGRVG